VKQDVERAERHLRVVADDIARLSEERRELGDRRANTIAEAGMAGSRAPRHRRTNRTSRRGVDERAATNGSRKRDSQSTARGGGRSSRTTPVHVVRFCAAWSRARRRYVAARAHNQEIGEGSARVEELRRFDRRNRSPGASVDEEKAREENRIAQATSRLTAARERADALAAELAELNRAAAASRDARAAVEVQRAEAMARVSFVRESCANELNQSSKKSRANWFPMNRSISKRAAPASKNCASGWKTSAP